MPFLTCIIQAVLSHIKPGIIQHFSLDLFVLVEFVLLCETWKTKSLLQVSYNYCIAIAQKGQTHLLAATMHRTGHLRYHQTYVQRMGKKKPLSGQAQHPLHWLYAP